MSIRKFSKSGLKNSASPSTPLIDYLVVAGGGGAGGAGAQNSCSGGAGGGGVLYAKNISISSGTSYTVTVGNGGNGGQAIDRANVETLDASPGGNSVISGTGLSVTAYGGGCSPNSNGTYVGPSRNGGSGAGGTCNPRNQGSDNSVGWPGYPGNGIVFQGHDGAYAASYGQSGAESYSSGGGGGAGGPGKNCNTNFNSPGGDGGPGAGFSIEGFLAYYGGGGGGGVYNDTFFTVGGIGGGANGGGYGQYNGSSGTANTGGGGGGTGGRAVAGYIATSGGNGGSGVVIIRYPLSYKEATTTGSPTITTSGNYRIYKFTGDGSITF